jgi:hypothetical protein
MRYGVRLLLLKEIVYLKFSIDVRITGCCSVGSLCIFLNMEKMD